MYSNFWSKKKTAQNHDFIRILSKLQKQNLKIIFSYKKYKISLVNNDFCKVSIDKSYSIWKLKKNQAF